jgi:hypothetical protein
MSRISLASVALLVVVTSGVAWAAKTVSLEGIKCPLSGAPAKADKMVNHLDGQVHFCCDNCVKKFSGDKEKFAAKANHQLVATKQYEQKACPFSGGGLNADTAIELAGAKVAFCCNNCKGKAEKMSDADKVENLFGKAAFEKAKFAKVEAKK